MTGSVFDASRLLDVVGDGISEGQRDALTDTPGRWWRAVREMTIGYEIDVEALLAVQFDDVQADEMIVLRSVPFVSLCEHHLFPFTGFATVGYVPNAASRRVVGLSKLARLVDAHARRLQVQERMTSDIAADLERYLSPQGAGCVVVGEHTCMTCRGVRKSGQMVTSRLLGSFKDGVPRSEFLTLAGV